MEKLVGYADHWNANIWSATGNKSPMDFNQLLPLLKQHLPIEVQFGGFPPAFNDFDSFGRWPYERSFQVQWSTNRFTIIGWPHNEGDFTTNRLLNLLRNDISKKCDIEHKWGTDNDLFMVLGEIAYTELLSDAELKQLKHAAQHIEFEIRDYLARHKINLVINEDEVCVAQYEVETLALDSTVPHRIKNPNMSTALISSLYS